MQRGKLIVLDGGDGAGKATQVRLLVARLKAEGRVVETLDFPQYTQNFFGKLLRECLDGARGDFMAVDPRIASTLYAADRFESKSRLEEWLSAGAVVILDRYVSSNMMHQGAKIADEADMQHFLNWLDEMEHGVFAIPRPDLIVYLDVPYKTRFSLIASDTTRAKIDTAEADMAHQVACEARARAIVARYNNWKSVRCTRNEQMREKEAIHEDVYVHVAHALQH